jgi:dihydrofolate reductase
MFAKHEIRVECDCIYMLGKIIVAMTHDGGIGMNNTIPWSLPGDMKFFQQTTMAAKHGKRNAVIMGRKTWESLPHRPLRGRFNVIVSNTMSAASEIDKDVLFVPSFDLAIQELVARDAEIDVVFAIGGTGIYLAALGHTMFTECIITQILTPRIECDTFFPLCAVVKYGWQFEPILNSSATIRTKQGFRYTRIVLCRNETCHK